MSGIFKFVIASVAVLTAFASSAAFAGSGTVALGAPLGEQLGVILGTGLPFGDGGILGLAAAGVIGGVWLARRKR